MNSFQFYNPTKLIFGKGQLSKLKTEVPLYGKRVLLLYGGGSIKRSGLYDQVMSSLKEIGAEVVNELLIWFNTMHKHVLHINDLIHKLREQNEGSAEEFS